MARQIVHEHNVAALQGGGEEVLHPGFEHLAVHRPVDGHGSGDLVMTQASYEGRHPPVAMGHLAHQPASFAAAPVAADHVGGHPGFIDEDQTAAIELRLVVPQFPPRRLNVRAVLFAGVQGFF